VNLLDWKGDGDNTKGLFPPEPTEGGDKVE
jgi:hypothetical protein